MSEVKRYVLVECYEKLYQDILEITHQNKNNDENSTLNRAYDKASSEGGEDYSGVYIKTEKSMIKIAEIGENRKQKVNVVTEKLKSILKLTVAVVFKAKKKDGKEV